MALVRASALKDFRGTSLSTTEVTTGYQLGALTTGQYVYAGMHLTSVLGTGVGNIGTTMRMLVMSIQMATASAFGSPTTVGAFTLSTAQGGQWSTGLSVPSTEYTWWRASWAASTAGSTGGTWKGLVYAGIK